MEAPGQLPSLPSPKSGADRWEAQTWQNLPDLPHTDARAPPPINTVRHRSQHDVSTRKMSMFDDKTNDGHAGDNHRIEH